MDYLNLETAPLPAFTLTVDEITPAGSGDVELSSPEQTGANTEMVKK